MLNFLDKIPYTVLIIFTVMMLLAPAKPMPHVVEKILMLKNGTLHRPMDIFDLFFHLFPLILLVLKIIKDYK
ncbi:MAG: RND transporter [Desulfobacula sp.]|nr:RND transporter [Desulfobacula sp.]